MLAEEAGAEPAAHKPRILVVDDEQSLVELVRSYLEAEGFEVLYAYDGPNAIEKTRQEHPALIILDIMLPGIDGLEVTRQLRTFTNAYVLMLTSRSQEVDKLLGLTVGADDYLTKPFSPRELVARVKAILRRSRVPGTTQDVADIPPVLYFGDLGINMARYEVTLGGEPIHLTPREFALLATLAEHPGMVFTRNQLLRRIWGDEYYDDRLVDVHMASLRKKLEENTSQPRYIQTVRGVGYRLERQPTSM